MKQHPKTSGGGGLSEPLTVAEEINAITGATETSGDNPNASDDARTFKVESDQHSNNSNENSAQGTSAQVAGMVPLPADGGSDAIASIVSDGLVFKVREDNTVELIGAAATPPKGDFSLPASVTSDSTTYEVAALAKDAFAHCQELTSISLPATLREVDPDALKGCTSLKSLSISPKSEAFASSDGMLFSKDYSKLLLIPEGKEGAAVIPGKTSSVPTLAFSRCPGILTITVGDGGTAFSTLNGMLFTNNLKTLVACPPALGAAVVLPTETETIGEHAFAGCKNLASITALGNIREIDSSAFTDEAKASAVVALPAGENYETRKAVWEAAGFQHFAEPAKPGATTKPGDSQEATSGLTYTLLDDYTLAVSWEGKDDPATELEIPASAEINGVPYRVSTIAENAFTNRGSLTNVKLPTSIITINNGAFAGCANLSAIDLPNTLRTIGERAFEATSLKDVWLPASINSIGSRAFASCESLERVVALDTPEVATDVLVGCTNTSIYIPSGSEDSWNPGLPSEGNHLMPYGVSLSEESLTIEAGQEANLLEGGNLQAPDPIEASYSYAATPVSVDAGQVSAKKEGTTDVTTVLSLDGVELTRATRTVEVSPNPEAEANVSLLNSETPIPATYLADLRAAAAPVSVTAPIAVVFGASGYDVSKPATSLTATADFVNTSSTPAYISGITCNNAGVSEILEAKSGSEALTSQKLFSIYPNTDNIVSFGYGDNVKTISSIASNVFSLNANSTLSCTFRLNLGDATVKASEADGGATIKSLANVVYTYTPLPLGYGAGDPQTSSFYLKDKTTNQVYTAAQVKEHANAIARGNAAIYAAYETLMFHEDSYECKVRLSNEGPHRVRIIGMNEDELTESNGDVKLAGLTFQFVDCLDYYDSDIYNYNQGHRFNRDGSYEGAWGGSELRARMNPGIDDSIKHGIDNDCIWEKIPDDLQKEIATVNKKYSVAATWDNEIIAVSSDKLFLASYSELVSGSRWTTDYKWTSEEGLQYKYWRDQEINNDGNNEKLIKYSIISREAVEWWTRTISPESGMAFLAVNKQGNPTYGHDANTSLGVCPCFCL